MKSYIEGIGKAVTGAREALEGQSPIIKAKFAEMGRSAIAQAAAAQQALSEKSSQACEIACQVLDSPQVREVSNSIASGISTLKDSVGKAVVPGCLPQGSSELPAEMKKAGEQASIENAIAKLSGRDKVGVSAEILTAAGGSAAGAAAAGTIAGAAGATTLLGSTGLASIFGGIFVTTTPVGWVIGSAIVAGAAGYGLMKMVRSGAQQDVSRKEMIERLTQRLSSLQIRSAEQASLVELKQLVALTLASELISEGQGCRMIELVENGAMDPAIAIHRMKTVALESGIIEETHSYSQSTGHERN
jgi:hypothetical protein